MTGTYYSPKDIFAKRGGPLPRALVAPQRYIQGPGVINHIGHYLSLLKVRRVGVLASRRGLGSQGLQVADSLQAAHMLRLIHSLMVSAQTKKLNGMLRFLAIKRLIV